MSCAPCHVVLSAAFGNGCVIPILQKGNLNNFAIQGLGAELLNGFEWSSVWLQMRCSRDCRQQTLTNTSCVLCTLLSTQYLLNHSTFTSALGGEGGSCIIFHFVAGETEAQDVMFLVKSHNPVGKGSCWGPAPRSSALWVCAPKRQCLSPSTFPRSWKVHLQPFESTHQTWIKHLQDFSPSYTHLWVEHQLEMCPWVGWVGKHGGVAWSPFLNICKIWFWNFCL